MKRIITLILAFVVLTAVTAGAANSLEIKEITVDGSNMKVSFETSGLDAEDQITLLTYSASSADEEATESNIVYIDQIDKAENTSISFNLKESAAGTYQVKMGGTDIAAPGILSITVDAGMNGKACFMPNTVKIFPGTAEENQYIRNEKGSFTVIEKNTNYIAAYASAPALSGYTVKEYGIRLNGKDYSAKVELNSDGYGMIFKGNGIGVNKDVVAFPYVIYEKDGAEDITYFGNTFADTLFIAE